MNFLQSMIIVLSVLPFFPFLIVYTVSFLMTKEKKKSVMKAMDVTTFFLIISVAALFNNIFGSRFGFYLILLLLLLALGFIGGAQNRIKGKVDGKRLCKAVWRLTFLGMSVGYILFTLIGLFRYIFQHVS